MKDEHTYGKKMDRKGRKKVIYKGTFISNRSLDTLQIFTNGLHKDCLETNVPLQMTFVRPFLAIFLTDV